jgi:hypothetical protein
MIRARAAFCAASERRGRTSTVGSLATEEAKRIKDWPGLGTSGGRQLFSPDARSPRVHTRIFRLIREVDY